MGRCRLAGLAQRGCQAIRRSCRDAAEDFAPAALSQQPLHAHQQPVAERINPLQPQGDTWQQATPCGDSSASFLLPHPLSRTAGPIPGPAQEDRPHVNRCHFSQWHFSPYHQGLILSGGCAEQGQAHPPELLATPQAPWMARRNLLQGQASASARQAGSTAPAALRVARQRRWLSAAKASGSEVRVGNVIERKGRMYEVVKAQHTQQGRGGATIQVELRDVQSGTKTTEKLRTAESIDVVFVDARPFSFLYAEGSTAHLMDPATFEQLSVPLTFFGEAGALLQEGMEVQVKYFNGEPLMGQMPQRITALVAEAEPHVKGNTATPSTKKVVLEGGLMVQVPPFVVQGDRIVVQTSDLSYVTRA